MMQEQYFEISESRMKEILRLLRLHSSYKEYADVCEAKIRSHPAPSAPDIRAISVEPHPPGKESLQCDNTCPAKCPGCEDTCPLYEHDATIRNQTQEVSMRMYSLMLEVKQENTDEFMEYYEKRMHEFEKALGIHRSDP